MASGNVQPISPDEVGEYQGIIFPDVVIEAFNELIARNFVNGSATVKQKDVVELIKAKGLDSGDIYNKGWLNIEALYRSKGWEVTYDKPGYNESYDPSFKFRCKRK